MTSRGQAGNFEWQQASAAPKTLQLSNTAMVKHWRVPHRANGDVEVQTSLTSFVRYGSLRGRGMLATCAQKA